MPLTTRDTVAVETRIDIRVAILGVTAYLQQVAIGVVIVAAVLVDLALADMSWDTTQARMAALLAGLPVEVAGLTVNRLCGSGLVDAVDAFCDTIGFTPSQTQRVFEAARALGLPVKLHAEQLSDQNGAALAARFGALSCDHLEHLSAEGIAAMKQAGTVAMLLPGAYYFLRDTTLPPVAAPPGRRTGGRRWPWWRPWRWLCRRCTPRWQSSSTRMRFSSRSGLGLSRCTWASCAMGAHAISSSAPC